MFNFMMLSVIVMLNQAIACMDSKIWMDEINDQVIEVIKTPMPDEEKAQSIANIFKPKLDIELFTKKIVGRVYWQEASEADRKKLQKNLYHIMLKDYTEAIVQTLASKPKVHRVRKNSDNADMNTVTVAFNTQRGKILLANFSLQCHGDEWKIYDISVEGVRLTDLQQSKYKSILSKSGIAGLNENLMK